MTAFDNSGNKSESRTEEERARVRAMLQAKLNAPPDPPLEAAKKFFNAFFSDEDWEESKERLTKRVALNPHAVLAGLAGVEGLLADPPAEPGVLFEMVSWDANKPLEDPTDAGAKVWLREVAEMVREVLGDKQPPRLELG